MITIFNRRELAVTFSMREQASLRDALDAKGIDYSIKVINSNSPTVMNDMRAYTGMFGQDQELAYEYRIFVRRKDFAFAQAVISGKI